MPRIEFGADGIRGLAESWPLLPHVAVRIGQALGEILRQRSEHPFVVIGRDTRPSGPSLLHNLSAGLRGQGVDVVDLGVMTTPGVAFLARRLRADLGVIISASHNPLEYNGIKLVGPNGLRLRREEEIEIEAMINECIAAAVEYAPLTGQLTEGKHLVQLYIQDHVQRCPAQSLGTLSIVLDCGDGAASRVAPEAFRQLGAEVSVINDAIEGKSINYRCGSEYVRQHPKELAEILRQHKAQYGFSFDGDGDRVAVVDSSGQVFDGEDLLFVLAMYLRSQGLLRRDTVVTSDLANRGLEETLRRAGIQVRYASKGDRNLEEAMWGGDYLLGGEPGGNIIINDGHHTAADAVYAALFLGGLLAQHPDAQLRDLAAPLRKRPQVTRSFEIPASLALEQRSALQEHIRQREAELGEGSRILVWDSTTEPGVFRVMVEGCSESMLEEVSKMTEAICRVVQQIADSTS